MVSFVGVVLIAFCLLAPAKSARTAESAASLTDTHSEFPVRLIENTNKYIFGCFSMFYWNAPFRHNCFVYIFCFFTFKSFFKSFFTFFCRTQPVSDARPSLFTFDIKKGPLHQVFLTKRKRYIDMATDNIKAALFNKKCFFVVPVPFLYYTSGKPVAMLDVLSLELSVKRRFWKPKTNFYPGLAFCPTVNDPKQPSKK